MRALGWMWVWMWVLSVGWAVGQAAGKPGVAAPAPPAAAGAVKGPASTGDAGAAKAANDLQTLIKRLSAVQENWGAKTSSPGVTLKLVQVRHEGTRFAYEMHVSGAPAGKLYSMISWPVSATEAHEEGGGVTLSPAGVAICEGVADRCKLPKPNDPIAVTVEPKPGEPIRIGLLSSDRTVRAFAQVTPLPLLGVDKGCRLQATLMTPHAEIVWLEAGGLPANTTFAMISTMEGKASQIVGKTDAAGKFHTVMLPELKGVTHGTDVVELKAQGCAPLVKFSWGTTPAAAKPAGK